MPPRLSLGDGSFPALSASLGTSFSQTGSISWIELARCLVSGSLGIYQRLSGSDVGVDTVLVGQMLGGCFKFGRNGRRNFLKTLEQLPSLGTYGDIIWFGFGVKHLIRDLATKEEGGTLVALCSALSCYDEEVAAEIFYEMVDAFNIDNRPVPSVLQWKSLLKVCSGVLAASDFPVKAETLMQKCSTSSYLNSNATNIDLDSSKIRGHADPESVAKALLAIGNISTGRLESITIAGSADGGWLAAVAEYMFDLSVVIVATDGRECYRNCKTNEMVQLIVKFTEQDRQIDNSALECSDQLFRVQRTMGMFRRRDGSLGMGLLSGRVEWSSAFKITFGKDFEKLLSMKVLAGKAIGNAARVFEAVASSEEGVSLNTSRNCASYSDGSRGRGLISSAQFFFPELKPMQYDMDQGIRMSFEDAKAAYEANRSALCHGCGCMICQKGEDSEQSQENFCSVIVLETIIVVIRSISGMTITEQLRLTRSGLEMFYNRQLRVNFCASHEQDREILSYGKISNLLEVEYAELDEDWQNTEAVAVRRLIDAARLFAGRDIPGSCWHTSAICVNGICIFLDIFHKISDHSEDIARCHVMPGSIEMQEKTFDWIEDLSYNQALGMPTRRRRGIDGISASAVSIHDFQDEFSGTTLIVCEKMRCIQAALLLQRKSAPALLVAPAQLGASLVNSSGLVSCNGKTCGPTTISMADLNAKLTNIMEGPVSVWRFHSSEIGRCVATSVTLSPQYTTLFQGRACLNCCVQAALRLGSGHVLILQPENNAMVQN